ncbi:MAG: SRPBCC domain-containing protein [Streptosporangiaceae bacterium]|nr:SRPBCC domain-containing protein [Streptosporangiaceae bacterium]
MRSTTAHADIAATAAAVWAALTSPAQTPRYFAGLGITSAWQPDAGVNAHHGTDLIATGTVVIADKPTLLIYWLDEPHTGDIDCWLAWQLTQDQPGITRVTLTADTLPTDPPVDVAELLSNLKAYLETSGTADGTRPHQTRWRPPWPRPRASRPPALASPNPNGCPQPGPPRCGAPAAAVAQPRHLVRDRHDHRRTRNPAAPTRDRGRAHPVRRTIGFNPTGPLDGAIRDLAAKPWRPATTSSQRVDIGKDAASYIGLSGDISLDVHAMPVLAGDPAFASALRHLDSGTATVMVIGIHSLSGYAVISADRITADPSRPRLPPPVARDARAMLGSRRTVRRTYHP